jgi:hypothetical protein
MGNYGQFEKSGPCKIGYKNFRTKQGVECSVFYPAEHSGDGKYGVPYFTYGEKNIEGYQKAMASKHKTDFSNSVPKVFNFLLHTKVPVYEDANPGLSQMQPIVFSHGMTSHRMRYSALFMELASCGYFVVTMTHNDGSADYSPEAGFYDDSVKFYD